jgi:hypothetical protein
VIAAMLKRRLKASDQETTGLGGFELLDGEEAGPGGNNSEPPQSGRYLGADRDSLWDV